MRCMISRTVRGRFGDSEDTPMHRSFWIATLFACCLPLSSAPAEDDAAPRSTYDPVALFERLDANSDGEMGLDEFLQLMETSAKLRGRPDATRRLFSQLNTNRDRFLSLDEFVKIVNIGQNQPPVAKPEPKKPISIPPDMPATPEGIAFFEQHIRPVLVDKCYQCHSEKAEEIGGNFVLDTRAGIRSGGDLGPAVVPGNLKETVLLKAIRHKSDSLQMPPDEKLTDEVIVDFEKWILMGAPDPRDGEAKIAHHEIDIEKGRQWWAFQPPKKSPPPEVKDTTWPRSDIDRYLLAALEAKGMSPVRDARHLKKLMDGLGIECSIHMNTDFTNYRAALDDKMAFLKEHLGVADEKSAKQGAKQCLTSTSFDDPRGAITRNEHAATFGSLKIVRGEASLSANNVCNLS